MTTQLRQSQTVTEQEPEVARLFRAWEYLRSEQKEDLIYLAQSMANRNRKERRKNVNSLAKAA
jgi:hypothetical protein